MCNKNKSPQQEPAADLIKIFGLTCVLQSMNWEEIERAGSVIFRVCLGGQDARSNPSLKIEMRELLETST